MVAKSLLRTCFVLMFVLGRSPVASASLPEYNNSDIETPSPAQGLKKHSSDLLVAFTLSLVTVHLPCYNHILTLMHSTTKPPLPRAS